MPGRVGSACVFRRGGGRLGGTGRGGLFGVVEDVLQVAFEEDVRAVFADAADRRTGFWDQVAGAGWRQTSSVSRCRLQELERACEALKVLLFLGLFEERGDAVDRGAYRCSRSGGIFRADGSGAAGLSAAAGNLSHEGVEFLGRPDDPDDGELARWQSPDHLSSPRRSSRRVWCKAFRRRRARCSSRARRR